MIARQLQFLVSGCRTDQAAVPADDRDFLGHPPDVVAAGWDISSPSNLSELTLCFSVSRDEEYVALRALGDRYVIDLGARAHHMVLLVLARRRLADRKMWAASSADHRAPPPPSHSFEGWVYQDELATKLAMDETHVNVAVFRSRRQLAQAGISGAAGIIERRRPTRELRLGVARIEIEAV